MIGIIIAFVVGFAVGVGVAIWLLLHGDSGLRLPW